MDIQKTAHLARIELTESEMQEFGEQLDHILEYVKQLEGVDIEGIEPMAHAAPVFDVYRPDETEPERVLGQEEVLGNAPETAHGQIKMPRVIE